MKLILVTDYMLDNAGQLPDNAYIRSKGHDLAGLIGEVRAITALRSDLGLRYPYPDDPIIAEIISVLSEFATATRYFNLDLLIGGKSKQMQDPLAAWATRVGPLITAKHYRPSKAAADQARAKVFGALMENHSSVHFTAEDGAPITSFEGMLVHSSRTEILQKWGQFHCFRLVRHLAEVLTNLGTEAWQENLDLPYFNDFFRVFYNDDSYVKSRKTWQII